MIKILFPTDYSSTANNAFLYALQMCKNYDGELLVMHSYAPNIVSGHLSAQLTQDAASGTTLGAFDIFEQKVQELRAIANENDLSQVSVKFILEEGELVQNIQEITSREPIHLIIMGTTGNSGFENKILGSKTAAVIKSITLPVLSVPHLCKFEGIDAVGFSTIYDDKDAAVLRKMIPYTKFNNADIYCMHVETGHETKSPEEIAQWKAEFKKDPVFFIDKKSDNVVETIFSFVEEHSLDIISCITRKKSFFQYLFNSSIAQKLSYHKRVPLLTFHEDQF